MSKRSSKSVKITLKVDYLYFGKGKSVSAPIKNRESEFHCTPKVRH